MLRRGLFAAVAALLFSLTAIASDVDKEKRWADQIIDALIEGDAIWLNAGEHKFLGIFTEAEDSASKHGAVVVHGIGVHPDWQQIVYPLRTGLPAHGWHTLSLQMPILPNDAEESEYAALMGEVAPRMDAGINFLKEQGVEKVVIIGHSLGSTMSSYYLSTGNRGVQGFVAVSMPTGIRNTEIVNAKMVTKIQVPILDLYGSNESPEFLAGVSEREGAIRKGAGGSYTSQKVEGANHFFDGEEDALVVSVHNWLEATVIGR